MSRNSSSFDVTSPPASTRVASAVVAVLTLLEAGSALAHPGHGDTDPQALAHALEPVHFAVPLVAVVLGLFVLARGNRARG